MRKRKEDDWVRFQQLILQAAPKGLPRLVQSKLSRIRSKLSSAGIFFEFELISQALNEIAEAFPSDYEYDSFPEYIQNVIKEEVQASVFRFKGLEKL